MAERKGYKSVVWLADKWAGQLVALWVWCLVVSKVDEMDYCWAADSVVGKDKMSVAAKVLLWVDMMAEKMGPAMVVPKAS